MKKTIYLLLPILLGLLIVLHAYKKTETKRIAKSNENLRIIAKFDKENISGNTLITKTKNVQSKNIRKLFERFNVLELQAVFKNRYNENGRLKKPITDKNKIYLGGWQKIIVPDNKQAAELVKFLKKESGVLEAYIEKPILLKPCIIPDDADYENQWHLNSNISPNADIDIEQAWNINTGRSDVIIAVCDGGVDYTHPDLDPGDRSRIIAGYDSGNDDNDPMDDLPNNDPNSYAGHGTKVAGVIAAITNNDNQVAGVMWNCKIMPVKMVGTGRLEITFPFGSVNWDFSTTAFPSDVADAIDYAVNNNAHIINLSYGFADMGSLINEVILRVPLLYEAISNAYANDVVTVVAMGNEYEDGNPTNYPAAFAHEVIGVGATNLLAQKANFSSTGQHINVSAPGTGIWTTERGGGTSNPSGTSFSAPIVSGVAGLIISQGLDRNFNLTNDDVRHILEITADDIDPIGFDEKTGYGKVNAHSALVLLDEPNELYHGTSFSGSTTMTNLSKWIYIGKRWGLSPTTYLDVDQYEITKHIEFDVSFCSVPKVWIRDRECVSMSFASPNDGFPWAEISNVTKTGFDVRYSAYYVRTNVLGQTINKWIPSTINSTKIAYTAVGEPNIASTAGPITGQSVICTSSTDYSISNLPIGCTISWDQSENLTRISAQGSNPCTFQVNGSGVGSIKATISGNCGDVVLPSKTVWLGPPAARIVGLAELAPYSSSTYTALPYFNCPISSYLWNISSSDYAFAYFSNTTQSYEIETKGKLGVFYLYLTTTNACGSQNLLKSITVTSGGGGGLPRSVEVPAIIIYPNPATDYINVKVSDGIISEIQENKALKYELILYNSSQQIVYRKKSDSQLISIDSKHLDKGFYYLHFIYKNEIIKEQVVISK